MGKRVNTATWHEKYQRWQINVQKDGIRKSFYSSKQGRTGQRECNAKADAWLDDNMDNTKIKVSALFAEYLQSQKETTSKSNWLKIESIGKNWILPNIGTIRIENLNEQHLQKIIDKAVAAGRAKKTISNIRAIEMSFLKYCRKCKKTTLLPENVSIPKSVRSNSKNVLQPDALKILFQSEQTVYRKKTIPDKYINAYRFQVCTGLRPGELVALKWDDISDGVVNIRQSINAYGEKTSGKNEKAQRRFALSPLACSILQNQKKMNTNKYIFDILNQEHYRESWGRYCKANNIEYVSPYELRHTFVSIAKQLPAGEVKNLVGHSKNMDTFGVYGHDMNGDAERVANQINTLFEGLLSQE